jgi:flagellar hook-length control protein FliK
LLAAVTRDVSGGKTTPTEGSDRPIDGVKLRLDAGSTGNSSFLRSTLAEGAFPGTTVSTEKSAATLRQASDGIQLAIRNGREVSVSLTPGELGQITIRVSTDQGVVSAKIEAQTAAGYLALNDSLGQLRDSLQQHGLVLDRLEVSLAERSNSDTQGGTSDRNNNAWTQSGWGRQGDGSSGQPGSEGDARNDTPANDSQPTDRKSETPSRGRMQTGRLDLQV